MASDPVLVISDCRTKQCACPELSLSLDRGGATMQVLIEQRCSVLSQMACTNRADLYSGFRISPDGRPNFAAICELAPRELTFKA